MELIKKEWLSTQSRFIIFSVVILFLVFTTGVAVGKLCCCHRGCPDSMMRDADSGKHAGQLWGGKNINFNREKFKNINTSQENISPKQNNSGAEKVQIDNAKNPTSSDQGSVGVQVAQ